VIPPANRPYVRGSIMTLCIVVAITISGIIRLVFPAAVSTSSALQQLPDWVLLYLNLAWISSGAVTGAGIVSGHRQIEATGLMLMTTAFLAYFVAILFFKGDAALSVFYIFGYSVGAAWRAYYVLQGGFYLAVGRKP
jgi:hypothetical protein